jgi:type II restriction endonuclease, putative
MSNLNDKKQDNKNIKTYKEVFPQIYSYTLLENDYKNWEKIGYTERKNVEDRIAEQVKTAAIDLSNKCKVLWHEPAKYSSDDPKNIKFFTDHDFHKYLEKNGIQRRDGNLREWFYFGENSSKTSHDYFNEFAKKDYFSHSGEKLTYTLRKEQEEAVRKTLEYIKNHQIEKFTASDDESKFLWNAKPRFGKTLTTYDFALKFKAKNILIVTNRPAIAASWYDDFNKFIDGYDFISPVDSLKNEKVLTYEKYTDKCKETKTCRPQFTFLSLQDLKGSKHFGGKFDKLKHISEINWDLLVIDESHEAIETDKTDEAFSNIKRRFTLYLSGTPFKALASGSFSEEQIYNYTYYDEQKAKAEEIEKGEYFGPHTNLPDLKIFVYQMSNAISEKMEEGIKIDGKEEKYNFNLNDFFATHNGRFIDEESVKNFLHNLTHNEKYPFSSDKLRNELKHTFWLVGNRVESVRALKRLLNEDPFFKDYKVIEAVGKKDDDDNEELKEKSLNRVKKAIKKYDKTITLSVKQLTTGVTVKEWTAVLMLSDIQSESVYVQTMFRAQNPHQYVGKDGEVFRKESAYVFDFSPDRILRIYDDFANSLVSKSVKGKITEEERKNNIQTLLNYAPVIAEDFDGKMTEIDAKKVIMMPKVFLGRKVVESRFLSNDLFGINVFKTFSKNVTKRLNKLRSTDTSGSANKNRLDGEISNDTYNERVVAREKRISINRQDIFGDKIYGKGLKEIIDKNILDVDISENKDKFSENVADEIVDHLKETSFKKYSEIYGSKEKELKEIEKDVKEKVRELADSYIHPDMNQSDERKFKQELDDYLVEQLPQDTIRKKEEELFEQEEKEELRKQNDKLRTIGRALPMLIMASKNPEKLELGNIENSVSDEIFEEIFNESGAVEKFTKEDFCYLRDEATDENGNRIELFDTFVVNSSIQEFEKRRKEMADYINTDSPTDIFTYIAPQKSNLVFTPREIVTKMLNILEDENPGIFSNPNLTFCDLHIKSGLYLAEIAKRLNKGLEKVIRDKDARIKHIFEKQLYGFTPSKVIESIATNYVYGDFNVSKENIKERDLVKEFKEGRKLDMKFDVIIGNPPYQEDIGAGSEYPIYQYFMEEAYKTSNKVCLITPARFLFNAGGTPKKWNNKMLNDEHLKVEYYEQNSANIFPETDIKGGIAITYRDSNKVFGKIGTFTHFEELNSILNKVKKINSTYFDSIHNSFNSIRASNRLNFKKLEANIFEKLPELFSDVKRNSDIKVFGLLNKKRVYKYIIDDIVEDNGNLNAYKVLVPKANGTGAIGEVLSTPLIGEPLIGYTRTFISFGAFNNRKEAENCLKYVKTKFARTMLGILKITQNNETSRVWSYVPLQNFTNNSDIDWSKSITDIDKQLYKKYGLSDKEISFIEEKVKEMN